MKKLTSAPVNQRSTQDHATAIYRQDNLWYYQTEKGQEIGPFRYRSEAQSNLDKFLSELKQRLDNESK
ncbi:MAG TPA: hypothetical protein DEF79_02560 [Gammaproteobacteria bacterium]|nr:hypothetical protein [Gammaproteobacteria bacterium]